VQCVAIRGSRSLLRQFSTHAPRIGAQDCAKLSQPERLTKFRNPKSRHGAVFLFALCRHAEALDSFDRAIGFGFIDENGGGGGARLRNRQWLKQPK